MEVTPRTIGAEKGLQVGVTLRRYPQYRDRPEKPKEQLKDKATLRINTPGKHVVPSTLGRPPPGARPRSGLNRRHLRHRRGNGPMTAGIIEGIKDRKVHCTLFPADGP